MSQQPARAPSLWAEGIATFAGAALLTVGIFQFLEGIAAAAKDEVFVNTPSYVFKLDLTTWGWIHIVVGIVVAVIGGAILAGQNWARVAGIVVAVISGTLNFMWLPYYPFWAILIIGFNMAVIWALSQVRQASRS